MQDRLNNIKPIAIQPTSKRNPSRVRARKLSDIFSGLERGTPRGFTRVGEILPTVLKQIEKAIEERSIYSQTTQGPKG